MESCSERQRTNEPAFGRPIWCVAHKIRYKKFAAKSSLWKVGPRCCCHESEPPLCPVHWWLQSAHAPTVHLRERTERGGPRAGASQAPTLPPLNDEDKRPETQSALPSTKRNAISWLKSVVSSSVCWYEKSVCSQSCCSSCSSYN